MITDLKSVMGLEYRYQCKMWSMYGSTNSNKTACGTLILGCLHMDLYHTVFAWSSSRSRGQQLQQSCPDSPLPSHVHLLRGNPEAFPGQPTYIIPSVRPGSICSMHGSPNLNRTVWWSLILRSFHMHAHMYLCNHAWLMSATDLHWYNLSVSVTKFSEILWYQHRFEVGSRALHCELLMKMSCWRLLSFRIWPQKLNWKSSFFEEKKSGFFFSCKNHAALLSTFPGLKTRFCILF